MIFDANASYGPTVTPRLEQCRSPDELLQAMDWAGIDRALVTPDLIRRGAPLAMNPLVAEEMKDYDRLEPVWALLPTQTGEVGSADEFFASMKASCVKVLAAFPGRHSYALNRLTCGDILDGMAERRIPLLLQLTQRPDGTSGWVLATEILREFPELRMIAVGSGPWGEDRLFRPLLDAYEGLHVEVSRYELDGGIADLVEFCGAQRLVFGSGYPETAPGGALMTVLHAEISSDDRDAIMGGNLARLLEEVEL